MTKTPKKIAPIVNVIQDAADPVAFDVLAKAIVTIADGVTKMRDAGISDSTIYLLIQDAAPSIGGRYKVAPIPIKIIRSVIEGMENLKAKHLRNWKRV